MSSAAGYFALGLQFELHPLFKLREVINLAVQVPSKMSQLEQFVFRESHSPPHSEKNQQIGNIDPRNGAIISRDPRFGINITQHMSEILTVHEDKIMFPSINKAVMGNFIRKDLIKEGEFKVEQAMGDAGHHARMYADKQEAWLSGAMGKTKCLVEFEKYKAQLGRKREARLQSIAGLIQSIANKLQNRALEQAKEHFSQQLEGRLVKVPESEDYSRAVYKLRILREHAAANLKAMQNDMGPCQF